MKGHFKADRILAIGAIISALLGSPVSATNESCCNSIEQSNSELHSSPDVLESWLASRICSANNLISDAKGIASATQQFSDVAAAEISPRLAQAQPGARSNLTYSQILTQYHDALAAYMTHRQAVQQHISQFHQDNKMQQSINSSITVPSLKPLVVQAQDACNALQNQEKQLLQMEAKLQTMVEFLITQKGQVPPANYANALMSAETFAVQDREAAMSFENAVVAKQNLASQELHDKIHLAEDAGDFVETQKVYAEVNRREAIVQTETERAQIHLGLAQAFFSKLQMIGDSIQQKTSSGFMSDADVANANAELDAEYQRVQQLYALLQAAGPQPR